jgi:hypothetical protein
MPCRARPVKWAAAWCCGGAIQPHTYQELWMSTSTFNYPISSFFFQSLVKLQFSLSTLKYFHFSKLTGKVALILQCSLISSLSLIKQPFWVIAFFSRLHKLDSTWRMVFSGM